MWANAQTARVVWAISLTFFISESPLMSNAIAAHKHRTKLHVLRDRVKRAARDVKSGKVGAVERLKAHQANRAEYRAAHP
jgi:hypothetical protein